MLFFKKKQEIKTEEKSAPATPAEVLEAAGINIDAAMRYLADDMDIFNITVQSFAEDTPEKRELMRRCLDEGNTADFAVYVHGVKSNARTFGADALADIAYDLEIKSKEGDYSYISDNYARLIESWDAVIAAITRYLEMS